MLILSTISLANSDLSITGYSWLMVRLHFHTFTFITSCIKSPPNIFIIPDDAVDRRKLGLLIFSFLELRKDDILKLLHCVSAVLKAKFYGRDRRDQSHLYYLVYTKGLSTFPSDMYLTAKGDNGEITLEVSIFDLAWLIIHINEGAGDHELVHGSMLECSFRWKCIVQQ